MGGVRPARLPASDLKTSFILSCFSARRKILSNYQVFFGQKVGTRPSPVAKTPSPLRVFTIQPPCKTGTDHLLAATLTGPVPLRLGWGCPQWRRPPRQGGASEVPEGMCGSNLGVFCRVVEQGGGGVQPAAYFGRADSASLPAPPPPPQ